jgi:hypothetical protein
MKRTMRREAMSHERPGTKKWFLVFCVALLACCCATTLRAQTGTATLSGTVLDPAGRVVPGVAISTTNVDTAAVTTAKTNGDGIYVLPALRPGRYRVIVTKPGFKQIALTDVTLSTQDSVSRNFNLEVGAVSETVTVDANAERMASDDPALGLLVNRDFVEDTPLNGRSFQDLLALAPGAVSSQGLYSFNGQYTDANYFTVDGVSANTKIDVGGDPQGLAGALPAQTALGTTQSLASVDAIQEFKVQTSDYSAEYGRQPGGQVQITTRSGTNEIHGSMFDYLRNTVFDANYWMATHSDIPKQAERQNDFGGTIGGPLSIPRIYSGKDKTFFFFSYEGLRLAEPALSGVQDVPTVAFRQFAATTVQPFLNALPIPNGPDNGDQCALSAGYTFSCTAQWASGYSLPSRLDSINARIDENVGERLQIFLRYSQTPSSQTSMGAPNQGETNIGNGQSWTLGATARLSPSLADEIRFAYSSSRSGQTGFVEAIGGAVPYPVSLVVPPQYGQYGANVTTGIPNADAFEIPSDYASDFSQHQYNVVDGLSWQRGSHSVKFGVDYRKQLPLFNPGNYGVDYIMFSLSDFQQGSLDDLVVAAEQVARPIYNNLSLYAEDLWKVNSRLSFDYGLRWELNPAPGATNGILPLALTTANISLAQLAPSGTPQYKTRYRNFAPRIGVAYQLNASQAHPLVVRSAFGVFYDTGQELAGLGYSGFPFTNFNILSSVSLPPPAADLVPPSLSLPLVPPYSDVSASDPNLRSPYVEQWNLSISGGLTRRNTLTASYVGNKGNELLFFANYNSFTVNPNFQSLVLETNQSWSKYNALQVQDQGYIAPGLQIIASYTFAHAIDNASSDFSQVAPIAGNSNFDVRQTFNLALNYVVSAPQGHGVWEGVARGWHLDGRFAAFSGYPVSVIQSNYILSNGQAAFSVPDLVPGVPIYLHNQPGVLGGWELNKNAFACVPTNIANSCFGTPTREGTLGRNFIHGPAFWNVNTAIQRDFPIHDRLRLVFRCDAFNILNHPNAGNINGRLESSTFGESGAQAEVGVPNALYSTGSPRSFQFALKLQF